MSGTGTPAPAPIETPVAAAPVAPAVAETPAAVAAPAVEATSPPATATEAAPTPAPAAETPAEAPKDAAEKSLLSDAPTEVKAEEKPADAEKPADEIPRPAYEALKLPEGVTLDDSLVGKFSDMLGDFEISTKADHVAMQGLRQNLADFYVAETKRAMEAQRNEWVKVRDGWKNSFVADKKMGGANQQQTLAQCGAMIEQYGGSAAERKELRDAFRVTGMGDHPALIRLLNNIGKTLSEGKPVNANPQKDIPQSKSKRRYGNSSTMNGAS